MHTVTDRLTRTDQFEIKTGFKNKFPVGFRSGVAAKGMGQVASREQEIANQDRKINYRKFTKKFPSERNSVAPQ
jgi:hypothetical protein